MNPGQSVKDRAALYIIRDAERRGPAAARRPRSSRAPPATPASAWPWSPRRWATAPPSSSRAPRARRRRTPSACWAPNWSRWTPSPTPTRQLRALFRPPGRGAWRKSEPAGAIWANQFDNVANRQAHVETTGPEIWAQTGGKVDGFICAVGSGGTLAGVAMALREQEARRRHRPGRPARRGALQLLRPRRAEGRGDLDHRGHRPGPHHRQPRGPERRLRLSDLRRGDAAGDLRPGRARGPGAWAARPGSMSPARSAWPRDLGPGQTIVTILCDYGSALSEQALQPRLPARSAACRRRPGCELTHDDPLVSTDWLAERLGEPGPAWSSTRTWFMPGDAARRPRRVRRAATSRARSSSTSTRSPTTPADLPHMLPTPAGFAVARAAAGRRAATATVVVYDAQGLFSAPRVWWTLPGHGPCARSFVLDGGLPKWSAEGRPVETGWPQHAARRVQGPASTPDLVRDLDAVRGARRDRTPHRSSTPAPPPASAARRRSRAPGLRGGHMPGALQPALVRRGRRRRDRWPTEPMLERCSRRPGSTSTGRSSPPAAPASPPPSWRWPWPGSAAGDVAGLRRLLDRMGRPGRHAGRHRALRT